MRNVSILAGLLLLAPGASAFSPEGYEDPGPALTDDQARALGLKPGEYTPVPQGETTAPRTGAGFQERRRGVRGPGELESTPPSRPRLPARVAPRGNASPAPSLTDASGQRLAPVREGAVPRSVAPAPGGDLPDGGEPPPGGDAPSGEKSAATPPPSAAGPRVDAGSTRRVSTRLEGMKKALGGLGEAGAFPGSGDASKAAAAPGGPQPAAPAPGADPLLAAVASGYDATLRDMGLRRGAGPDGRPALLDRAGRPAGPEALDALAARLRSEPRGAQRRSDFYDKLPRRGYERLVSDFSATNGARAAYKDIGLDGPDFAWTRSCDRVSGDCNPHAAEPSYRRNEDVSPETLAGVWNAVKDGSPDDGWDAYVQEQKQAYREEREREAGAQGIRDKLGRSVFKPGSRLSQVFEGLMAAAGFKTAWGGSGSDGSAAAYAASGAAGAGAAGEKGLAVRDPGRPGAGARPQPVAPPRPWGRLLLGLLGAVAAGAALRLFLAREDARVRLPPPPRRRDQ